MSELKFIDTEAGPIRDGILEDLENGVNEPLYPGDRKSVV